MTLGHVEKTNDRDYEVEERYDRSYTRGCGNGSDTGIDDTEQWKRLPCDYRRRRRVIWTRCEVGGIPP